MGIFSRRDKVVDLSEDYRYERKKLKDSLKITAQSNPPAQTQETSGGSFFNFFGGSNASNTSSSSSEVQPTSDSNTGTSETFDAHEKRRRLAKRLKDMTDRIEDMSNQIYLLQQRIEVLERKNNVNNYE